jgi:hypothetical protein
MASYWGKRFAPGRWDQGENTHHYIAQTTDPTAQIDANAILIPLDDATAEGFSFPGVFYIGQETISATALSGGEMTGVTKGLYSLFETQAGDNHAYVYPRVMEGDPGYNMAVSTVPFSWMGRMVALYGAYWDETTGKWCDEDDAELLWVGRISNQIVQSGATRKWKLSCTSVIDDLKRKIGTNFPTATLQHINLTGAFGRDFWIVVHDDNGIVDLFSYTLPKGLYTPRELIDEIKDALANDANWNLASPDITAELHFSSGENKCWFRFLSRSAGSYFNPRRIEVWLNPTGWPCHALHALGFPLYGFLSGGWDTGGGVGDSSGPESDIHAGAPWYCSYMPLATLCNGGKIFCQSSSRLWSDQGDDSSETQAHVKIPKVTFSADEGVEGACFYKYTSIDRWTIYDSAAVRADDKLADILTIDKIHNEHRVHLSGFVGTKLNDPPREVQQVYKPVYELVSGSTKRYPFRMLLDPLLSSGTSGFNGFYDCLPRELSYGLPLDIVDWQSFLDADEGIKQLAVAQRSHYFIDSAVSWSELAKRECVLFGRAIVWRNGKITCVKLSEPDVDQYTTTINDSSHTSPNEFPDLKFDLGSVINQYECEVGYDYTTGKYGAPITITDVDSVVGLQTTKTVKLKHPGITIAEVDGEMGDYQLVISWPGVLLPVLLSRMWRTPLPIVEVTLAPKHINQVFVGDVVRFISSRISDPAGTGTYDTDVTATVIKVSWDYSRVVPIGKCAMFLHAQNAGQGDPWGATALIDRTHSVGDFTGGWDPNTLQLKTIENEFGNSADPADASAYSATDEILIVERAAQDPTSPLSWGPFAVDKEFETDGTLILTLEAGTVLANWDPNREYVVVPAHYHQVTAAQKLVGSWQAPHDTRILATDTAAQRYT